jgi:origin recognition complex subunit 5
VGPHHPSLKSLYSHFISTLCDACGPFTHDTQELEYIAAARWPGFVQPVLDEYQRQSQMKRQSDDLFGDEMDEDTSHHTTEEPVDLQLGPPSEDMRMRLIHLFTPSLSIALEALYPRLTNATDWAMENAPDGDILAKNHAQLVKEPKQRSKRQEDSLIRSLPRMSKFILVAAFLASTNPAKSDIRMFGRGLDEKKRKRKRRTTKATGKTKGGPAKVCAVFTVLCFRE